jgi:polar amino acid transport system substrate-binding protein
MKTTALLLAVALGTAANANELPDFIGTKEVPSFQPAQAQGGLQFIAALDNPPFSFLDGSSRLNGFSVYLARAICEEMNYSNSCTISGRLSSDIDMELEADTANIVISKAAASPKARENYQFTKPILRIPARFAGRKAGANQLNFLKSLPDAKIGVAANSAHERMLRSYFPEAEATGYASNTLLLKDLKDGKIDLAFASGIDLANWLASAEGSDCCIFAGGPYYSSHFLGEGVRFAVPIASGNLVTQIDSALVSLQLKGRIEELFLRFFPISFY